MVSSAALRRGFHCLRAFFTGVSGALMVLAPHIAGEAFLEGNTEWSDDARTGAFNFMRIIGNSAVFVCGAHITAAIRGPADDSFSFTVLLLDCVLMGGEVMGMFIAGMGMDKIGVPMASLIAASVLWGTGQAGAHKGKGAKGS